MFAPICISKKKIVILSANWFIGRTRENRWFCIYKRTNGDGAERRFFVAQQS